MAAPASSLIRSPVSHGARTRLSLFNAHACYANVQITVMFMLNRTEKLLSYIATLVCVSLQATGAFSLVRDVSELHTNQHLYSSGSGGTRTCVQS